MASLTFAQQQAIKPLSKNKEQFYPQLINDVEAMYLSRILGAIFAQKVQATPLDYADLLDGSSFTWCGETVTHKGLRYVLAYYAYSEYVKNSDVADTFTGMVQQNRIETTHLSTGRINALRDSALQIADQALELVKAYLNENSALYPFWFCANTRKAHAPKLIEIRSIGNNSNIPNHLINRFIP